MKYIFVTGGVVSGLGKGICAASLGCLLKQCGLKVKNQKFDPYLNVDPGTMSPYQHGEVFVTDDGAETDLDLGHYERFVDEALDEKSSVSSGKIFWSVLNRERQGGYLGGTVQIIPHVTDEIKRRIYDMDDGETDVAISEIGGTVGDIEFVIVRPSDAPAFVGCGGADCGICGWDSLIEADLNLLQLVDLGYGLCTFIEAEPAWRAGQAERNYARRGSLRVATKYPRIASAWYAERGVNADIVSLHGNIELGPIVGMTDRIVDIAATGATLRDNDLVITGRIMDCTARFFVNPGAARLDPRVRNLADRLAAAVKDKHFEPVAGSAQ